MSGGATSTPEEEALFLPHALASLSVIRCYHGPDPGSTSDNGGKIDYEAL